MRKYFIFLMGLFLILFANFYCFAAGPMVGDVHKGHRDENKKQNLELSGKLIDAIRVIEIKASRYKFEPNPIVVKLGERVRLVVTSTDVAHGIAIPKLKIKLAVPAGKTKSVEFVADKQGVFHAHCSVYCGPGHGHMHATLVVR
jgi:heme/copper-type cytochrome/quinol oxidase subunit 2